MSSFFKAPIWAICALLFCAGTIRADEAPAVEHGDANRSGTKVVLQSAPGSKAQAEKYYADVGASLGLALNVGSGESTVTQIVDYLGFEGMTANDLEVQPPHRLMPKTQAELDTLAKDAEFPAAFAARRLADFQDDKVVAVRFFAPKVANYEGAHLGSAKPGWRKLVRLQALVGSPARDNGIEAGWILFNTIRPGDTAGGINDIYPTKQNQSEFVNAEAIQIILERTPEAIVKDGPSLFFLAYHGKYNRDEPSSVSYGLSLSLKAKFDVAGAYPGAEPDIYYVPSACAQCHGLPFKGEALKELDLVLNGARAKRLSLNYLDTDQWFDARRSGDFGILENVDIPELIDADQAKDPAAYKVVFARFRALNRFIAAQNQAASPNSFATRAANVWLLNHGASANHVDRWARTLPPPPISPDAPVWDPTNANDANLLPALDRYCARCHMTMFFGIYDKASVADAACAAIKRIRHDDPNAKLFERMPQGRKFQDPAKSSLIAFLDALNQEKLAREGSELKPCP